MWNAVYGRQRRAPVRIVLDTNVVLSALLWRGTPHQLLGAIAQRPYIQLCSSTALLEELAGVLTRLSAVKRLALIDRTAHDVLADYVEATYPSGLIEQRPRTAGVLRRHSFNRR